MTREFVTISKCSAFGLLNQKLIRVGLGRSHEVEETSYDVHTQESQTTMVCGPTTFFTTDIDVVTSMNSVLKFTIDPEKVPGLF